LEEKEYSFTQEISLIAPQFPNIIKKTLTIKYEDDEEWSEDPWSANPFAPENDEMPDEDEVFPNAMQMTSYRHKPSSPIIPKKLRVSKKRNR